LIAGGLATTLAGAGGGSAVVPLGENVGVMAVTKVYSTAAYVAAAVGAIVLSFCPKVTALVDTLPGGVLGGMSLVLFGTVVMIGVRVWLDNRVDVADPLTMMVAGAAIVAGAGNLTIDLGGLRLGGVVWGSLLIVVGYPLLRMLRALRTSHGLKRAARQHGRSSGRDPALGR
jgi:xanthine/uracil permease